MFLLSLDGIPQALSLFAGTYLYTESILSKSPTVHGQGSHLDHLILSWVYTNQEASTAPPPVIKLRKKNMITTDI